MPSSTDSWGIEVGAHAIKAIHLQKSGGGKGGARASLVEHEVIPHKKVLTTPDLDIGDAIRTALAQFVAKKQVGRASVVVSVPGNMAFARFAKLPPVEPKRVPDIVKFEAIQQIPFPIDQVEWDYQVFQTTDSPEVDVGIFAITKEKVLGWLSHFEAAGIPVHGVTLSPLAVYNAMAYDLELGPEAPGTMLMDVGTLSTDLVVVHEGRIWLRTLPLGGHHFTEAIVKGFKLNYSKAEKIKKEAATSKYARQIFQAMRPVFVDLVAEVQKSLGYYQSINREVQVRSIVGMGSTFRLPGLQKFIKQQLQIEVSRLDSYKRIEPEARIAAEFAEHAPELATAYGLALQGLEMESVSANVLPASLIRQQIWRTKTKWNIAAAACLAASAAIPIMKLTLDRSAYASSQQQFSGQISGGVAAAKQRKDDLDALKTVDPRSEIESVRAIHDMRDFWPLLMLDVQSAVAKSAQGQPKLKSGDEALIKKVNRRDRRVLYIDSITPEYLADGSGKLGSGGPGGGPGGGFGMMPRGGPPAGGGGGGGGGEGEGGGGEGAAAKRPALVVTVIGVTPYRDSRKYVIDTIYDYLDKEVNLQRRPYKVTEVTVPKFDAAASVEELRKSVEQPGGDMMPGGRRRGRGGFGFQGGESSREVKPRRPGGVIRAVTPKETPGNAPGVPGGVDPAANIEVKDIMDFFPEPPLADEERTFDQAFTMKFKVELRDPVEARQVMAMNDKEFAKWLDDQNKPKTEGGEGGEGGGEGQAAEGGEKPAEEGAAPPAEGAETKEPPAEGGDASAPGTEPKPEPSETAPASEDAAKEGKP